jgi:hypothetical protein
MKKALFFIALGFGLAAPAFAQTSPNGGSKYQTAITHTEDPPQMKAIKAAMKKRAERHACRLSCRIMNHFHKKNPIATAKHDRAATWHSR